MSDHATNLDRLFDLVGTVCDGGASPNDFLELDSIVRVDGGVRDWYLDYCRLHSALRLELRADLATQAVCQQIGVKPSAIGSSELNVVNAETSPSPAPAFPAALFHSTLGYFSSGWPVAYLVATVIFSIGLLVGAFTYVSQPEQVARQSVPSPEPLAPSPQPPVPSPSFVGRITGMVDCRWVHSPDPALDSRLSTLVSLGDRFTLASGLMEITYDTGAKVILQGPVTYEVESAAGGYLSLGKLTARVEGRGSRGEGTPNLQISKSPNPLLSTIHYPLFTIRTSTAVVTDLGTEFGVKVDESGDASVDVFDGNVECRSILYGKPTGEAQRVAAGQTARIAAGKVAIDRTTPSDVAFVRSIRPASTARPPLAAYWRFEEDVPPATVVNKNHVQEDVIRDWGKQRNPLTFYPGPADGWGSYIAGSDVPPPSMFRSGCSGGKKSFNSGALDAHKTGVLFHNTAMHGSGLNFPGSFCIEGFFKTDGDQSAAGMMAIVYKGPGTAAYLVSVNRQSPGAAQFTLFDSAGSEASVSVSDRNYADGQWHYFAARFTPGTMIAGGTVSLLMGNEDSSVDRSSAATAPGFTVNTPSNNLFIGRKVHGHLSDQIEGHFRGLIDEVRICRGDVSDNQLLFPIGKEGH